MKIGLIVICRIAHNEYRPAIIVKLEKTSSNLQIFLNGSSDIAFGFNSTETDAGLAFRKDVPHGKDIGEWDWTE